MGNNLKQKKTNKVAKAAVFGSFIGVLMGLILAPKSGQELRHDLTEQAQKIGDKAVDIRDKAQSAWQNVEEKTDVTVDAGKRWFQKGNRLVSKLKILVYEMRHGL